MKQVQVHCIEADGTKSVINRFTSLNSECYRKPELRQMLLARALKVAFDWGKVYPNDKFVVAEV